MHKYEVALMMNEKRLTNSFKSYIGLDDDDQVNTFLYYTCNTCLLYIRLNQCIITYEYAYLVLCIFLL